MGRFYAWWHPESYAGLNRIEVVWVRFLREPRYRVRLLAGLIGFLAVMALPGYHAWHWFHQYREQTYVQQAGQFLDESNLAQAVVCSQVVLRLNPNNLRATHILAEVAVLKRDPAAIHWRERELELNPCFTNELSLAATALHLEPYPFPIAAKTLYNVAPADQKTPEYRQLAGLLALQFSQPQTSGMK